MRCWYFDVPCRSWMACFGSPAVPKMPLSSAVRTQLPLMVATFKATITLEAKWWNLSKFGVEPANSGYCSSGLNLLCLSFSAQVNQARSDPQVSTANEYTRANIWRVQHWGLWMRPKQKASSQTPVQCKEPSKQQ